MKLRGFIVIDHLLKIGRKLFITHLDIVGVTDFLSPAILLPLLVLEHANFVHRAHPDHIVGLGLNLCCSLEHFSCSIFQFLIARELQHAHFTSHFHDFIDSLLINFLEKADSESLFQIVAS